jgi:HlyD family secretion protein
MINNAWRAATVLGLTVAGGACGTSDPAATSLQGVVEYEERDLSFEVTGRIAEVAVHEGDTLPPGSLVARIVPDIERSALTARESEARAAEAQLGLLRAGARPEDIRALAARSDAARASESLLRTNAERSRKLFAAKALSPAALDEAEARLARAEAERRATDEAVFAARRGARSQEIDAAQGRLSAARASTDVQRERVSRYELRTLEVGEVLQVHLRTSELAVAGVPVVTVADTSHPYADVFVAASAAAGIRAGVGAHARTDGVPNAVGGRVEHVSRRTEFTPRYLFSNAERENLVVRVRVRLDDPGRRLTAGVPVFVRLDRAPEAAAP